MQHALDYLPRSPGGQDWSGAGAGYSAACRCGEWTFDGVVRDPRNPADRREAEQAFFMHDASAD